MYRTGDRISIVNKPGVDRPNLLKPVPIWIDNHWAIVRRICLDQYEFLRPNVTEKEVMELNNA